MSLVLWAPTVVMAGLVWLLVSKPPALLAREPLLSFAFMELLRATPLVTLLSGAATVLALAVSLGLGYARRPLQAALVLGAVAPLVLGIRLAWQLPLPEGLSSPEKWRLLFSLPAIVAGLISGIPAAVAVWLLEKPDARRWLAGG